MRTVVYRENRAIVTIVTEITEESMVGLVDEIDRLNSQYFYRTIELRVSSPGGTGQALDYYLVALQRFREQDVVIHSRALTQACSAGAAIVSLAEGTREAEASSVLVYHASRLKSEAVVTARVAEEMHRALGKGDHLMIWRIAVRAYRAYGPGGELEKPKERGVDAFSDTDWRIMRQLAGTKFRQRSVLSAKKKAKCLAALRDRVAEDCEQHADPAGFFRLYQELFDIDAPMTGALACELRLIDRLVDDEDARPSAEEAGSGAGTVRIPGWHRLFPSGRIERSALCRHVMVFGETGSGKTASAILPVLKAVLRQANGVSSGHTPVSCALVIDPKKEILPILQKGTPDGVGLRVLRSGRASQPGLQLNLMLGEWSIADDLAANDMSGAAHRILLCCASFLPKNPAFEMLLQRGGTDNAYWKDQGVRLAQTILSLLLILLKFRTVIYDPQNLNAMAPYVKAKLREVGVVAGFVAPESKEAGRAYAGLVKAVNAHARQMLREARISRHVMMRIGQEEPSGPKRKALFSVEERRELRAAWQVFAKRIWASQKDNIELREHVKEQRKEFAELLKSPKTPRPSQVLAALKATAESCWDQACPMLPEESIVPCRNLMALAAIFQQRFFVGGSGRDLGEDDQLLVDDDAPLGAFNREYAHPRHFFLAHRLVERTLRDLITGGRGVDDVFDEVDYFHSLCAARNDVQHFTGLYAFAKPTFADFSESGPAQALFFGCEPFLTARGKARWRKAPANLFAGAINSKKRGTIYVYQPALGHGKDTLIARALKAQFFETVLSDPQRQQNGSDMPLVAYVADEFHRFITSDVVHGEQSFFDTCRSFGAFCVVASQSMSSLYHGLAGDAYTNKDKSAVEILLNNTGTKLFFRTTDRALHRTIDRLCPVTPSLPKATEVRPPSSLRPGECYAVVTDGRFLRCKVDLEAVCQGTTDTVR